MPEKKYSEEELVNLLKQNNKAAFSYLYDHYSGALFGIILKIVNQDEETSEDVLQDVFIKIWKKIATYDSTKGTLFTWMLNIGIPLSIKFGPLKTHQSNPSITTYIVLMKYISINRRKTKLE